MEFEECAKKTSFRSMGHILAHVGVERQTNIHNTHTHTHTHTYIHTFFLKRISGSKVHVHMWPSTSCGHVPG